MFLSIEDIIINNIKTYIECFEEKKNNDGKLVFSCCIDGCGKPYTEKSSAIRHLNKHHKEVYDYIKSVKLAPAEKTKSTFSFEIRVKVNPNDIMDACAELITVHGLPLSVVEYPAFKRLLHPYVVALQMKGVDLSINKNTIKKHIANRTNEVKKIISSETKNKMVSLMIDIASRYNRSVLGVTIAYMHGGEICVRTISMHVLKASHTGAHIRDLLKNILADYGIRLAQIVSITTDNGSNMLKAIALLDNLYQNKKASNIDQTTQNQPGQSESTGNEDEDEYYINTDIFDEEYYRNLLSEVESEFETTCSSDLIHGIPCAAHCIDLVVSHAVDTSPEIVRLLKKCRTLAKTLRTPTLRAKLKAENFNMAMIDVSTRWNSVYTMV